MLAADRYGDKVLALPSGRIMKIFRRKRIISSALYSPYTRRFRRNAETLKHTGIPTVKDVEELQLKSLSRTAVCYSPLDGITLHEILRTEGKFSPELAAMFGKFVAQLHEKGVFFRSMHMGNVVLTADNKLGLIDIADLKHYRRPLSVNLRVRNFRHTCRYRQDRLAMYSDKNFAAYWESYTRYSSSLNESQKRRLRKRLQQQLDAASAQ